MLEKVQRRVLFVGLPLPRALFSPTIVPHQESLVLIGGHTDSGNVNTMYWYNPKTGLWTLMPERLMAGAHSVVAFPVARQAFIYI